MHQRSVQTNREFEQCMHLDVSRNMLTDDAIKSFAELIAKFEGFKSVNLMSIRPRMNKKDLMKMIMIILLQSSEQVLLVVLILLQEMGKADLGILEVEVI